MLHGNQHLPKTGKTRIPLDQECSLLCLLVRRCGWLVVEGKAGLDDLQGSLATSVSMIESLGITNLLVQFSLRNWAAGIIVMLVVWKTTSHPEVGKMSWEAGWEVTASPGRLLAETP